jgi:methylthioxylose transferase
MLAAIVLADLSMLSKAETERIWLPFTVWLTAAPALLPTRSHRVWLVVNAGGALVLNSVILTNW